MHYINCAMHLHILCAALKVGCTTKLERKDGVVRLSVFVYNYCFSSYIFLCVSLLTFHNKAV